MKLFRRKTKSHFVPGSTVSLYGVSDEVSDPVKDFYGIPTEDLSSGTYATLERWIQPPSGTVYDYNRLLNQFDVAPANREVTNINIKGKNFNIMDCSYCRNKVVINENFTKEALVSLSCPSCGARLK